MIIGCCGAATRKLLWAGSHLASIRKSRIRQPATVQATIAEDGQVIDLKPVNGNSAFLSDVAVAVNEWRYEPTYVDNKPAETQAQIEIDFHPPTTLRASKR